MKEDNALIFGIGTRLVDKPTRSSGNAGLRFTYYLTKWGTYDSVKAPFLIGLYLNGEW
ncbi:MAG: hypothetical protein FWB85_03620 [Chitinispirillia bacterium]|nr:hypothetical protein [Chitinispirillia bacterium]MCL2241761.1 hypothetical protein [Chitinispirillia bacterium]